MNIEYFDDNDNDETEEEWEDRFQISYTTGKPSPMKVQRKKKESSWQKIDRMKDDAVLRQQISEDAYYSLD